MLSHAGCVRETNQDVVAFMLPGGHTDNADALAIVADGMGGHLSGEIASRMAADIVLQLYRELHGELPDVLGRCIEAANTAIYQRSRHEPECAGMGTTCTVLALHDGRAFLAHIGDSRAYLLRDGELHQISEDHSLVAKLVREGTLTSEEAQRSPQRNVILRALGSEAQARPVIWREGLPTQDGDVFVLCSDGLTDVVSAEVIADIAGRLEPGDACEALLAKSLAEGAPDNVAVGVFAVNHTAAPSDDVRSTRPISRPVA